VSDDQDRDGRHAMARGYVLASRVMSIGFQMIIPVGLGWWADSAWKTTPWLMLLGVVVGFSVAMMELVQLTRESASSTKSHAPDNQRNDNERGDDS